MGESSKGSFGPDTIKGTGIALIVLTTIVVAGRFGGSIRRFKDLKAEDYFLIIGYLFFLELTVLYIYIAPVIFRIAALQAGRIAPYATILQDSRQLQIVFFVTTSSLWLCLWMIKYSLLAMYKRLLVGKAYLIAWWTIAGFSTLVRLVAHTILGYEYYTDKQISLVYYWLYTLLLVLLLKLPCLVHRRRMWNTPRPSRRRHQLILCLRGRHNH
jgi:hypothetical protein